MSLSELAPSSKRLSSIRRACLPSAALQMSCSFSSICVRERDGWPRCACAQFGEFGKLGIKFAVDIALFEQMPLDLAARCLGDALHRHDLGDLEAGVLIDEPRNLIGQRQEVGELAAVQDEDHELVGLRAGGARRQRHDFAEIEPFGALRDRFQVVRVVVLAVDENDLFGPPGDVERHRS
jgi:hypothetical protein